MKQLSDGGRRATKNFQDQHCMLVEQLVRREGVSLTISKDRLTVIDDG